MKAVLHSLYSKGGCGWWIKVHKRDSQSPHLPFPEQFDCISKACLHFNGSVTGSGGPGGEENTIRKLAGEAVFNRKPLNRQERYNGGRGMFALLGWKTFSFH